MREARPNTLSSKCPIKETPTSARPSIIITSNLAPEIFYFVQNLSQTELTYTTDLPGILFLGQKLRHIWQGPKGQTISE